MKYLDLVKKLQKENEGYIVLIKNGIFFIGVGKDAVVLNELLKLNVTCMKKQLCKVGFLVKSLEKYIIKLKETKKSFVIYIYDKSSEAEEEIFRYTGEKIEEQRNCIDCIQCSKRKETEDEIIERVKKIGTES